MRKWDLSRVSCPIIGTVFYIRTAQSRNFEQVNQNRNSKNQNLYKFIQIWKQQQFIRQKPIEKLEKQDKRNKEIALEKTVEDTKKRILEVDMSERKFGQDEEKMVYFFLLSSLRKEHFNEVGIEDKGSYYYLTSEDKMRIIENLTAKQKAVIRRDYLIANFKDAFGNNATASLLLDFAQKHMPEELANIQDGYNEVYEKRHQRIEEKKAALQEQATQEAEQPDEPQPEAEAQTEPQAEEIAA